MRPLLGGVRRGILAGGAGERHGSPCPAQALRVSSAPCLSPPLGQACQECTGHAAALQACERCWCDATPPAQAPPCSSAASGPWTAPTPRPTSCGCWQPRCGGVNASSSSCSMFERGGRLCDTWFMPHACVAREDHLDRRPPLCHPHPPLQLGAQVTTNPGAGVTHVVATDVTDKARWANAQVGGAFGGGALVGGLDAGGVDRTHRRVGAAGCGKQDAVDGGWGTPGRWDGCCRRSACGAFSLPTPAPCCPSCCLPAGQARGEPWVAVVLRLHLAARQ